jgi:hypothetical protein
MREVQILGKLELFNKNLSVNPLRSQKRWLRPSSNVAKYGPMRDGLESKFVVRYRKGVIYESSNGAVRQFAFWADTDAGLRLDFKEFICHARLPTFLWECECACAQPLSA